jgi:hypothetical protein
MSIILGSGLVYLLFNDQEQKNKIIDSNSVIDTLRSQLKNKGSSDPAKYSALASLKFNADTALTQQININNNLSSQNYNLQENNEKINFKYNELLDIVKEKDISAAERQNINNSLGSRLTNEININNALASKINNLMTQRSSTALETVMSPVTTTAMSPATDFTPSPIVPSSTMSSLSPSYLSPSFSTNSRQTGTSYIGISYNPKTEDISNLLALIQSLLSNMQNDVCIISNNENNFENMKQSLKQYIIMNMEYQENNTVNNLDANSAREIMKAYVTMYFDELNNQIQNKNDETYGININIYTLERIKNANIDINKYKPIIFNIIDQIILIISDNNKIDVDKFIQFISDLYYSMCPNININNL